jgi:TDG/mug DNA glycosylase family protein
VQDTDILPDVLQSNLLIVFCGTAAGNASAAAREYYRHSNNKFWTVLHETGLTKEKLKSHEYARVKEFGIGLTDLCKRHSGNDKHIRITPEDCHCLEQKIKKYRPQFLAFTSLNAGKRFCGYKSELGLQDRVIGETRIYILPSTSPSADWNWKTTKTHWDTFAQLALLDKSNRT